MKLCGFGRLWVFNTPMQLWQLEQAFISQPWPEQAVAAATTERLICSEGGQAAHCAQLTDIWGNSGPHATVAAAPPQKASFSAVQIQHHRQPLHCSHQADGLLLKQPICPTSRPSGQPIQNRGVQTAVQVPDVAHSKSAASLVILRRVFESQGG